MAITGTMPIGNLISDASEGITKIDWTVYACPLWRGKISEIKKTDESTIRYTYDAAGNRISKTVIPPSGARGLTWYVRDASGNVMAVYTVTGKDSLYQSEQHLYGSSRLGIFNRNKNADASLPQGVNADLIGKYVISYFTIGNKNYELGNHLGNVLLTLSDKKFGHSTDGSLIDYFEADVVSANDYYPGGMGMPGRKYGTMGRYGFNGKERDKETSSTTTYDYGFRIYSPALGRFLSVDPLAKAYSELTPYQFASNSPIQGIDIDGREIENFMNGMKKKIFGVSSLQVNNLNTVIGEVQQQSYTVNLGNPTKTVNDLKNQIGKDINSIYGTGKGTFEFEKQQKAGQITKGDFINIDPGLKGVDMSVKVADVQTYNNDMVGVDVPHTGFSVTFRTMEGHVEVGSIKFTALEFTNPETGAKSFEFNVSSTSQIDNGVATTILNGYARRAQQQVWQQVLKNVSGYMEGDIESAYQRIDKYKINDITPVNNSETSIGYPKTDAVPASTETKDLEIKNK